MNHTLAVKSAKQSERFLLHLIQHWLTLFIVGGGVFVTLPWLAPVFMKIGATGLGLPVIEPADGRRRRDAPAQRSAS